MFRDIDHVKAHNAAQGYKFFDPGTMRFFRSRIGDTLYGGRYFITSERVPNAPRQYTVRRANDNGTITTIGGLCQYTYAAAAKRTAAKLAANEGAE